MKRTSPLAALPLGSLASGTTSAAPMSSDPFVAGQDGVHTYRIPAMVLSPSGAVLVFCEARKQSLSDASPTDMVLRRSLDGGATWLPMQMLVRGEGTDALMNPVAVVDHVTGTVFLLCCNTNRAARGEHRRHLLLSSRDDGATWSEPVNIGSRIAGYDDTFVPGPGCGIQTRQGRLVAPGYTSPETIDGKDEHGFRSRVIYSDDGGERWRMGIQDFRLLEWAAGSAAAHPGTPEAESINSTLKKLSPVRWPRVADNLDAEIDKLRPPILTLDRNQAADASKAAPKTIK